jgi:rhodanese-related sulfurtransferase
MAAALMKLTCTQACMPYASSRNQVARICYAAGRPVRPHATQLAAHASTSSETHHLDRRLVVLGLAAASLAPVLVAQAQAEGVDESTPRDTTASGKKAELDALVDRFHNQFPDVPMVTSEQLLRRTAAVGSRVVLVDVRTRPEQLVSSIPGNTITSTEYEAHRDQFSGYDVVCYCTVGSRSARYARSLLQKQVPAAYLRGGILAWTQAGLPLVDGSTPALMTKKVHIYVDTLALQGEGYTAVV